jgi:hypothetical protein
MAQADELGADLRRAPQLTGAQVDAVSKFVKDHSANLGSDNPQLIKRDRISLLEPLADPQSSPAFRLRFSEAISGSLNTLAASENEIVVINAMVIAGDLATAQGVELLNKGLASAKPAVRYQAAFGFRRTFEALTSMSTPTMRPDQAESAIRAVSEAIAKESDGLVVDGLVFAGVEATKSASLRNTALMHLNTAISGRSRTLTTKANSDQISHAFLRAAAGTRDALAAAQQGQVSAEALKATAELAGNLIAYCVRVIESKSLPASEKAARETHSQLATTCENVLLLSVTLHGDKAPDARHIGEKLKSGSTASDAAFGEDARALIGDGGLLSKDPFKFKADAFLSK